MVCLRRVTGGTYFVKVKEDYEVWKILHMIVPSWKFMTSISILKTGEIFNKEVKKSI